MYAGLFSSFLEKGRTLHSSVPDGSSNHRQPTSQWLLKSKLSWQPTLLWFHCNVLLPIKASFVLSSSCPTFSPVHLSPDTEPTSGGRPFSSSERRLGEIPKEVGTGHSKADLSRQPRQV